MTATVGERERRAGRGKARQQARSGHRAGGVTRVWTRTDSPRLRKKERFTALLHHVSTDLLRVAYFWLKREAARERMGSHGRIRARIGSGLLICMPGFIAELPGATIAAAVHTKPDGRQRPLALRGGGQIVQRAGRGAERDLRGGLPRFSYGFRPGRGRTMRWTRWRSDRDPGGELVLDADIAGFFDAVSHDWLVRFVEHRIGDRRVSA